MLEERKGSFERIHPDGLKEGVIEITAALGAVVHRLPTSGFAHEGLEKDLGVISRMKVSTAFVQLLARAMDGGDYATEYGYIKTYKYHEWGTSTSAEANTQKCCVSHAESVKTVADSEYDPGTQVAAATSYSSVATMVCDATTATLAVTEHCLHPVAAVWDTDYGLDRSLFTAINLTPGDSITFTYTLNIPAE